MLPLTYLYHTLGCEASNANFHRSCTRRVTRFAVSAVFIRFVRSGINNFRTPDKLALLTPPEGLYKNVSNERLYQLATEEANNVETRVQVAFQKLRGPGNITSTRNSFYYEFIQCCQRQIEYLRAELIKRIGPSSIDPEEMLWFNAEKLGITDLQPTNSIGPVLEYIPRFRQLAAKLKRTG